MMEDGSALPLEEEGHAAGALDGWGSRASVLDVGPKRLANKRAPTDADAAVGRRIRDCRVAMGMSLSELSGQVGVSQPQLYRYECGLTRVAASRLIAIAAALGVSIEALVRGDDAAGLPIREAGISAEVDLLLRAFSNIGQPERRSALIALARSMADNTEAATAPR
ncbi:helix-turn-helix domain-containing protein [Roseomonas sp. AR75]|jgi:transcriptional regulator with XRE-family HTH domain|uniref:helix-turn-helix domain-containing protein n=1 Tax=Roseomonas sp. AR75 TaxID=2562311 RepID=UPI00148513F3|nr:helix-turn-helix domain-containing protein [Roseomonas sp. AR75]